MKPVLLLIILTGLTSARELRHRDHTDHVHADHVHADHVHADHIHADQVHADHVHADHVSDSQENHEEEFGIENGNSYEMEEGMEEEMDEMEEMEDEMDENEEDFGLRTEKCLISLAKACDLKRFCYDEKRKADLTPIIIGKDKIKGGQCPELKENMDKYQLVDANQRNKCHHSHANCTYCEEGLQKESVNVCFICHDETGTVVDKKEASVNITCEESYWKRFKKGYYDKKYGKGWWHKHHHKYEKKNKCKEGDYDKYAIRMTVSSCDSECTLL